MTAATLQENKMGVMPVGKLIANMALPMVISMLVQALYNVVDSIYVSQVSESACFPRVWVRKIRRPPTAPPETASC